VAVGLLADGLRPTAADNAFVDRAFAANAGCKIVGT
jgi:hypothetical protein